MCHDQFLTSQLVFTILVLAADKSKDTFLAPVGIGLALFIVEIAGVYYTGASVNPVRSFAPCVAAGNFQGYHWIYWLGPCMGGLLAAGYYRFVKWMNFGSLEEANPGQDSSDGAFDAKIEEVQSRQAEEGQSTEMYTSPAPPRQSWSGDQRTQAYGGAPPPQQQHAYGGNPIRDAGRRSGDQNGRRY